MSDLLTRLLTSRNINNIDEFLHPNIDRDWCDPYDIEGMEELVNKVELAIRSEKDILIYGDYDMDGMSATVVMLKGLSEIKKCMGYNFNLDYFIPDRFSEGYGLSEKSIQRLPKTDFIITVDCGITAKEEIEVLKEKGIEVVVTDHHEPSEIKPSVPFIDPQDEKNTILAGVGVAIKLIQCLGTKFGLPYLWKDLTDLAMLGTIADVVPLVGQNRALVIDGISKSQNCLKCISDVSSKDIVSAKDVGFNVIPRLNSAGRLGECDLAISLLNSDDYNEAYSYALELENLNNKRKEICEDLFQKALYQAENILSNSPDTNFLVVSGDNWHEGVLGIVATRIAIRFNLPTAVLSIKDGQAHGSGRSVGELDLYDIVSKSSDLLIKFGGHKGACGLTVEVDKINDLRERLNSLVDVSKLYTEMVYDIEVNLNELNIENIKDLNLLEPFGEGNPEPIFLANNVFIRNAKAVGANKDHLSCSITDGNISFQSIMFNCPNIDEILNLSSLTNVIFTPVVEEFRGYESVKLHIKGFVSNKDKEQVVLKEEEHIEEKLNLEGLNHEDLKQALIESMIGKEGKLHSSQNEALEMLDQGLSGLAVMPTGRGKSLIFQLYASLIALEHKKMSLFVYPLRALISDQAYHLEQMFSKFGLKTQVLNGETPQDKRDEIYKKMRDKQVDIILTTPEFLEIHQDKFSNIGFVVIDECHHLGDVKIGQRTAYASMPQILSKFNNPQVLALSATVDNEILKSIKEFLPIDKVITDNFSRENLFIDDKRNIKEKDDYLVSLVSGGEKTVIYVNSREQTVQLARMIKSNANHIAMKVGYYHAGMSKQDRKRIESLFRDNTLSVLIATSAFGEGVNIPDIRHVCLYHLPFSAVEFNQMSGRCGRDGQDSIVHLLYNSGDASINEQILSATNPNRDNLVKAYKWIQSKNGKVEVDFENPVFDIFHELGIIDIQKNRSNLVISIKNSNKVNLEDSSRFVEGQNEIGAFKNYKHIAMDMSAEDLTELLRHPIKPE